VESFPKGKKATKPGHNRTARLHAINRAPAPIQQLYDQDLLSVDLAARFGPDTKDEAITGEMARDLITGIRSRAVGRFIQSAHRPHRPRQADDQRGEVAHSVNGRIHFCSLGDRLKRPALELFGAAARTCCRPARPDRRDPPDDRPSLAFSRARSIPKGDRRRVS